MDVFDKMKSFFPSIDWNPKIKENIEEQNKETCPTWFDYWMEYQEKFDKNIRKALKKNKEEIIKYKKKYGGLDSYDDEQYEDYQFFFNDTLNFCDLIDEFIEFGANKYAKNDEQIDDIIQKWREEEAFIDLEEYAESLLSGFFDEV